MLIFDLVIAFGAVGFALWISFPSEKALRVRGERFAREQLAYVDSEFVVPFNSAVRRTRRQSAATLVVVIFVMLAADRADDRYASPLALMPVIGLVLLCVALMRLRMAGREFPAPAGRSLVARVRQVDLDDYVPPAMRAVVLGDVVVCLAMAAWAAVHPFKSDDLPTSRLVPAAAAGTLVVAILVIEVVGRAMCRRPQASVDPCHLYFQDAWRGGFLLGAYLWVGGGAFQFMASVPLFIVQDLPDNYFPLVGAVGMAEIVAFYRSRRQFRRRLWPTLHPGQVLLPGETVPPRTEAFA